MNGGSETVTARSASQLTASENQGKYIDMTWPGKSEKEWMRRADRSSVGPELSMVQQ